MENLPDTPGIGLNSLAVTSAACLQYDEAYIIKTFLSEMGYGPLNIKPINERLEATMRDEMNKRKLHCDQLEKTLHLAANLIELAYHDRDFAEKRTMALFNWYLIYVDDMTARDPTAVSQFEQRFLRGQPQLNPVLNALAEVILTMWEHCIEPGLETKPPVRGTQRFPWFMRERTGVSEAFSFLIFTKSTKLDIIEFVQAIPDINFFICVANDLLSFHKEDLAGEKSNYVYNRAHVENKAPLQVLAEMAEEVRVSVNTVDANLSHNPNALRIWKTFECGYIAWHVAQDRYKLKDLGF